MEELWNKLITEISEVGTDLSTTPKISKEPLWFHVFSDGTNLWVSNAKEKTPSSKITKPRRLTQTEFERVYPIHLKREQGASVSKEAIEATRNQVYWFSILKNYL